MSLYAFRNYWPIVKTSWKAAAPCDFHSPDIGTHADLCGRCGWQRAEHASPLTPDAVDPVDDLGQKVATRASKS